MPPSATGNHLRSLKIDGRHSHSACPQKTLRLPCAVHAYLTSDRYSLFAAPGATGHSARFLPAPAVAITSAFSCAAEVTV